MERKWTEIKYHVQENALVELKDVKMYCNTNQFPELPFCGLHYKPHGARGLSKHYHLHFYPKLSMGVCAIHHIPCACVACTSMLYKPCIYGTPPDKQERYKPVTKCTYWTVLGAFNNCNVIQLSSKSTSSDTFDEIHQVVLDGISDNMASLVESGKYGAISTTDKSTNKIYVLMFSSGAYTLQENTTIDGQIITTRYLVVNEKYLCYIQVDTNWYWDKQPKNHVITVPTRTILHPQLEVNARTDFHEIPTSVCSST